MKKPISCLIFFILFVFTIVFTIILVLFGFKFGFNLIKDDIPDVKKSLAQITGIIGFYDIPFGTSKEEAINIMTQRGWKTNFLYKGTSENWGEWIHFYGGTYVSKKLSGDNCIVLYFYNNEFYYGILWY